jgi:hypothetical protein
MFVKGVAAALLVAVCGLSAASAQSAGDLSGPRELPPSSFTGQQYVDSRGCVFLRAGLAGRTNWVPRVTADRRQLCGYPPSLQPRPVAIAEAPAQAPVPAPAPTTGPRPIETVATTTAPPRLRQAPPPVSARVPAERYAAPPVVMPAPAPVAQPSAPKAAGKARLAGDALANGCYADAPVRQVFPLRGGGRVTLCTRGDGNLGHARAPHLPEGAAGAAPRGEVLSRHAGSVAPPPGYRPAWQDDRLNPMRGIGTAQGWAEQDQVWTRDHPARLVEHQEQPRKARFAQAGQVHASTKSAPLKSAPLPAGRGMVVQVGLFGQPANAQAAAARLAALGLPVRRGQMVRGGKALESIMAGPFASGGEAQAALSAIRRAGFGDAYLR